MEEWKTYTLGDIASMKYGKLPPKSQQRGTVPIYSGYRYVGVTNESNCKKGTIIVVARGVGGTGDVKLTKEDCFLTNLSIAIELDNSICLPEYFYYSHLLNNLRYLDSGSAQSQITIDDLKRLQLRLPAITEQKRVVTILRAIDDKIEINDRINHNLEEQAQAVFDSIFDNPVKEKILRLDSITEINPKRTLTKGANARCIDMSYLSTSGSFPSGWEYRQYSGGMKFINGDTLMARITPCLENGKVAYVNFLDEDEVAFGSTEYIVFHGKNGFPNEMFYFLTRNQNFIDYATKNMNGSSGRQRVSGETIGQYLIPELSDEEIEIIRISSKAAMTEILRNSMESINLRTMRDTLLTRLMSGETTC